MSERSEASRTPTNVPFTSTEFDSETYKEWLIQELRTATNILVANPTSGNYTTALLYEYASSKPVFIPAGVYGSPFEIHEALELTIEHAPESAQVHFQNSRVPTTTRTLDLLKDAAELFRDVCFSDHWNWPNNPVFDCVSELNRYPILFRERNQNAKLSPVSEERLKQYFERYYSSETAQKYAKFSSTGPLSGRSATQTVRDDFWERGVEFPDWLHELVELTAAFDFSLRKESSTQLLDERAFDLEVYSHFVGYDKFLSRVKRDGANIREQEDIECPFDEIKTDPSILFPSTSTFENVVWDSMVSREGRPVEIAISPSEGPAEMVAELLLRARADVVCVLGRDGTIHLRSGGHFNKCGDVAELFKGRGHSTGGWAVVQDITCQSEFDTFVGPAIEHILTSIRSV